MLHINDGIEGKKFYFNDKNVLYTCNGYGQDPTTGRDYIIGTFEELDASGKVIAIKLRTFNIYDINFVWYLVSS